MMKQTQAIGVCDSGVGGTSVVKQLMKLLPNEKILYFGDTARVPYGPRPKTEIIQFMEEIMEFFHKQQVKLAVIACNTMTSQALEVVKDKFPFPIVGVSSGARSALAATRSKRIGVIATQGTVASGYHARKIMEIDPDAAVIPQPCPRLVPFVEAGQIDGEEVREVVHTYLSPLMESQIDTLIYGCTHYPYLSKVISEILGPDVTLVDPAIETAEEAKAVLEKLGMLNLQRAIPEHNFYFSKNSSSIQVLVEDLMGGSFPAFRQAEVGTVT